MWLIGALKEEKRKYQSFVTKKFTSSWIFSGAKADPWILGMGSCHSKCAHTQKERLYTSFWLSDTPCQKYAKYNEQNFTRRNTGKGPLPAVSCRNALFRRPAKYNTIQLIFLFVLSLSKVDAVSSSGSGVSFGIIVTLGMAFLTASFAFVPVEEKANKVSFSVQQDASSRVPFCDI